MTYHRSFSAISAVALVASCALDPAALPSSRSPVGTDAWCVVGWKEVVVTFAVSVGNVVNRLGGVGGVVSCLSLCYGTRLCQELFTGVRGLAYHRTQNVDFSEAGLALRLGDGCCAREFVWKLAERWVKRKSVVN